jgi:hypothetical protein
VVSDTGRPHMPPYYARAFTPWILLAVIRGWNNQTRAITGLLAAALLITHDLYRGHRPDPLILEISTTIFMTLLSTLAVTAPERDWDTAPAGGAWTWARAAARSLLARPARWSGGDRRRGRCQHRQPGPPRVAPERDNPRPRHQRRRARPGWLRPDPYPLCTGDRR